MNVVLKFQVSIFYAFREISYQRALHPGRVGLGRVGQFIVLNNSASPKHIIELDSNFLRFF